MTTVPSFLLLDRRNNSKDSLFEKKIQVQPHIYPKEYLRKAQILFVLETDEDIIFMIDHFILETE